MVNPEERVEMPIFRAKRTRRNKATRGAATVEVLVAVSIVMMIGAIGIVSFGGTDRARLRSEATEVAMFLQRTRMRSLESRKKIEVIVSEKDGVINAGGERMRIGYGELSASRHRLLLHPSGESEGLIVSLRAKDEIFEVSLDWLTGRVAIQ